MEDATKSDGYLRADNASEFKADYGRNFRQFLALLFSPARGIFIFMPWTLLSVAGSIVVCWRSRGRDTWMWLHLLFTAAIFVAVSGHFVWYGGWSHGPRLQSDTVVSLAILAAPVIAMLAKRWWGLALVVELLLPAALVQYQAARMPTYNWESYFKSVPERAWDWKNADFMWYLRKGRQLRAVINETRPPVMEKNFIVPSMPDAEKYMGYGLRMMPNRSVFDVRAAESAFYFMLPEEHRTAPQLLLGIDFINPSTVQDYYRIRVKLNGEDLGVAVHRPGMANAKIFLIDSALLGKKPYDVLSLHFERWGADQRSVVYLDVTRIGFTPATEQDINRVRQNIMNLEAKAEPRNP